MTSDGDVLQSRPSRFVESFAPLEALGVCLAAFIKRIPGIDVTKNKVEALKLLEDAHHGALRTIGMLDWPLISGDQIHGNQILVVNAPVGRDEQFSGYDGFITDRPRTALGIYVADCCAVYIVDPKTPAVALVHSGKKGTELQIASKAIESMQREFGCKPADLIVQLSPCIRPPHYEIDFAADIREQCRAAGAKQIHDSGVCTACDLESYYSYRAEKGKTGRMLAVLGLL
jgi:copper oxidase (laccase) domain-containing protein